eukprot:4360772-Ditylum_brightwellii.AAC.1
MAMLWSVQHCWPQDMQFMLNCYCHWMLLMVQRPGEPALFLHSKERMLQGGPSFMIGYGVTLPPWQRLSRQQKRVHWQPSMQMTLSWMARQGPIQGCSNWSWSKVLTG